MSTAAQRAFFMLLGGAVIAPAVVPTGCEPYTKPHHLAANINLTELLVRVPNDAASTNLCEEMT